MVQGVAGRAGVPVLRASYGETRRLGALSWQVIAPSRPPSHESASPANDSSLVLLVEVQGVRILLLGDQEEPSQAQLLRETGGVRADVLKVAHHGSANQHPVTSADPMLAKSFVISAIVVMLCSLWPTLINTAVGAASIDKDLLAVGRVLKLGWFAKLTRLVLPSALPYIFTGMRLSLGVGWMVLIAAEMLAQNPGLGKFVWDEFQNGSSQSLARIMFAVVVIGFIGFGLDRIMMALQRLASKNRMV
jgi:ABC-type proline/glycine betaine transport system permease subunit